ncbi:extensin-like [Penaeus chinensis]|uniref:extensin-like n=1 Tax=Penaeus chinensis TaxID=139456 RepID=UPI001FB62A78|nr:extensin-like [Penaeus chinensis]
MTHPLPLRLDDEFIPHTPPPPHPIDKSQTPAAIQHHQSPAPNSNRTFAAPTTHTPKTRASNPSPLNNQRSPHNLPVRTHILSHNPHSLSGSQPQTLATASKKPTPESPAPPPPHLLQFPHEAPANSSPSATLLFNLSTLRDSKPLTHAPSRISPHPTALPFSQISCGKPKDLALNAPPSHPSLPQNNRPLNILSPQLSQRLEQTLHPTPHTPLIQPQPTNPPILNPKTRHPFSTDVKFSERLSQLLSPRNPTLPPRSIPHTRNLLYHTLINIQ